MQTKNGINDVRRKVCKEHYPIAKKYSSLTRWEAMAAIKKEIES
jgi:hypothetical protein